MYIMFQVSLQAIRSCIRRLRIEKKVHTMVLMAIFQEKIILINHHGIKLAEYPASQVSFCGKSTDNKHFFGLVTTRKELEDDETDTEIFSRYKKLYFYHQNFTIIICFSILLQFMTIYVDCRSFPVIY